jgi:enamine deaminase RidA (YjgF/YER057c/UK114 family)/rhodanese-related sulfurtransferase
MWLSFALRAATAGAAIEHVAVKHEGVEVRVAVAPPDATLAFTAQLLPTPAAGAAQDVTQQVESVLKQLDDVLAKVGASRDSLVRINLYATTDEAAPAARRAFETAVKCPVAPVVTQLPQSGALVAIEAIAVATGIERSPEPGQVRLLKSNRAVYISGMAAAKADMAEATRATLEQLDGVLRHFGIPKANVTTVKSFLRAEPGAVEAARAEIGKYFDGAAPPPLAWVQWMTKDAIEIEMIAELPEPKEATPAVADTVSFITPPGAKSSPVYSKVTIVHSGGRMLFTSGVNAAGEGRDATAETRLALAAMKEAITKAGGDFEHLVKATYYPSTDATTQALGKVRPEFFNPKRPPAASRALVRSTGAKGSGLTFDLIAASPLKREAGLESAPKPAAAPAPAGPGPSVSIEEFEALRQQKDVVVLDVRSPDEFAEGHVPGAKNVNVQDKSFADKAGQLDKSKTYVVYCQSGRRSERARMAMDKLGLKVTNFTGSMNEWMKSKKPVEQGEGK